MKALEILKDVLIDIKYIGFCKGTQKDIEPITSEFKVGDWVTDKGGKYPPLQVDKRDLSLIPLEDNYVLNNCKHWQPQQGEWCWFRDSRGEAVLKRFDQMCPIVPTNYIAKEGTISRNVEPFIGKLPSFLHVKGK